MFILFFKSSAIPNTTRFMDKYFSDEELEKDRIARDEHAQLLRNQLVGQKSASEIRQILRHKKKYDTEG